MPKTRQILAELPLLKILYIITVIMKLEFKPGIALGRRLNYKFIALHHDTKGEVIAVLKKDGSYQFASWKGFLTRAMAIEACGVPVKILVNQVGHEKNGGVRWKDVPANKHVQGCLVGDGCYCVLQSGVKLV